MAACAPQPSTPPTGDVCVSQAAFVASLEEFRELEPSASVIDGHAAWISVQRTFRDFRDYAFELADDRDFEVNQAIDALQSALDDVPAGAFAIEAVASLEDELAAVIAEVEALSSELDLSGLAHALGDLGYPGMRTAAPAPTCRGQVGQGCIPIAQGVGEPGWMCGPDARQRRGTPPHRGG